MQPESAAAREFVSTRRFVLACVVIVLVMSLSVVLGWTLDIPILRRLVPGQISMAPLTALGFLSAAVALGLLRNEAGKVWERRLGLCLSAGVAVLGGAILAEYLFGIDLGIEQALFRAPLAREGFAPLGRPAPTTAFSFLVVGLALVTTDTRRGKVVSLFTLLPLFVAVLALMGYASRSVPLYQLGAFTPMAFTTAFAFLVLELGLFASRPEHPLVRLVTLRQSGSSMARRLLPLAVLVLFLLGWIRLFGDRQGRFSTEMGLAFFITLDVSIISGLILLQARDLNRMDTEREKLTQDLEEEKDLLSTLINSLPDLVFIKDRASRFVLANRTLASLCGAQDPRELVGKSDHDFMPKDLADKYVADDRKVMEITQSQINTEEPSLLSHGGTRWLLTTKVPLVRAGSVVGLIGISRDITERKVFEQRIQQTQKLESLGVLAGGIAHDFNNILQTILGNAEMARAILPPASAASGNLQEIVRAAQRASDLARQMLAYSGKGMFKIQPLDLSDVISEMREMLHMSVSRKAVMKYTLAPGLPSIQADLSQLRQVIMNLVINASEALGETNGTIAVFTGLLDCDDAYLSSVWGGEQLAKGRYVSLEVADTGSGMDEGTRTRIFDPFFTTKFTGRGLGLAAVMGIVRSHGGAIKVYSEPGKGTTFKLLFPASEAPSTRLAHPDTSCGEWQGQGTILLVDDEEGIRSVGRQMLEHLGFCVLTAADGREALEILRAHRDEVACVILDLTMPSMDGEEAFEEMRKVAPDLKVILSSGFNEQTIIQQWVGKGLAGFIQKPYRLSTLEANLREVLGGSTKI